MQTPTNEALRALRFRLERCGFPVVATDLKDLIPLFLLEEKMKEKSTSDILSFLLADIGETEKTLSAEISEKEEALRSAEERFSALMQESFAALSEITEGAGNRPPSATLWGLERSAEWKRFSGELAGTILSAERRLSSFDTLPISEMFPLESSTTHSLWHFKALLALHEIEDATLRERLADLTVMQRERRRLEKIARERHDVELRVRSAVRTFRTSLLSKISFRQPNAPSVPKAETLTEILQLVQNHRNKLQDVLRTYPLLKGECSQ